MSASGNLNKDADELFRLAQLTESLNVKRILTTEAEKMKKLAEVEVNSADSSARRVTRTVNSTTKIVNYGWDQSDKFVKIYVSFNGVQNFPSENVTVDIQNKSFELRIVDSNKKVDHVLSIKSLLHVIVRADSHFKVKSDMVVIFLKKSSQEHWSDVTETDKKSKESKTPKFDKDDDPNANLMSLMKQMYDDGDDDMKRTIAKAWTEARDKKPTDELMQ